MSRVSGFGSRVSGVRGSGVWGLGFGIWKFINFFSLPFSRVGQTRGGTRKRQDSSHITTLLVALAGVSSIDRRANEAPANAGNEMGNLRGDPGVYGCHPRSPLSVIRGRVGWGEARYE